MSVVKELNQASNILTEIADTSLLMTRRKQQHIDICIEKNVESDAEPFKSIKFIPEALPEFNFNDLCTEQVFLNKLFSMPILITGMTGGVEKGSEINEALALVAEKLNIPMGLGSMKMYLKNNSIKNLFNVRKKAPNIFVIGNIGAVSLNYEVSAEDILSLISEFELNAFAIHLNALQECIQPEGERNFANLLQKIEHLVKSTSVPIIIKEVGSGISAKTFKQLVNAGVSAIDVGGRGGTSWSVIEGLRSENEENQKLGELFRNWGYSTDESILACVEIKKQYQYTIPLIATGGIRNGIQVAKAIAAGASMVGVGLPLMRAAVSPQKGETSYEAVERELLFFKKSLAIAMFCSGAQNLSQLSSKITR